MKNLQLETPVVLIVFQRPDLTAKLLEVVRQVRPSKLLVIADAPRANRAGEAEKCAAVRAIIDRIDWDCEVLKNYAEVNLGCGLRIATGLDWVFDRVEEAIILEDDCIPHPSFFYFCEELLEKYRHDPKVMTICGTKLNDNNAIGFLSSYNPLAPSYYFSQYFGTWGWATWRRAWQHFDFEMKRFPELLARDWFSQFFPNKREAGYWQRELEEVYRKAHTWDYQWELACWLENGLHVIPKVNLIANIGSGISATHTQDCYGLGIDIPVRAMSFPLEHPQAVARDELADRFTQKAILAADRPSLIYRARRKLKNIFREKLLYRSNVQEPSF